MELARRNKRFSQADVSALARVAQTFVSAVEKGNALPTPDQRERLARVLEVPADILLDEVPQPAAKPEVAEATS